MRRAATARRALARRVARRRARGVAVCRRLAGGCRSRRATSASPRRDSPRARRERRAVELGVARVARIVERARASDARDANPRDESDCVAIRSAATDMYAMTAALDYGIVEDDDGGDYDLAMDALAIERRATEFLLDDDGSTTSEGGEGEGEGEGGARSGERRHRGEHGSNGEFRDASVRYRLLCPTTRIGRVIGKEGTGDQGDARGDGGAGQGGADDARGGRTRDISRERGRSDGRRRWRGDDDG